MNPSLSHKPLLFIALMCLLGMAQGCSETRHTQMKDDQTDPRKEGCVWHQDKLNQGLLFLHHEDSGLALGIKPSYKTQHPPLTFVLQSEPFGLVIKLNDRNVGLSMHLPKITKGTLLYLKDAHTRVIDGLLHLSNKTHVEPIGHNNDGQGLRARISAVAHYGYQTKQPIEFNVGCSELVLAPTPTPPNGKDKTQEGQRKILTKGEPIAVRPSPDGPIHGFIVTKDLGKRELDALSFEESQGLTRISFQLPNQGPHLRGWIPSDRLKQRPFRGLSDALRARGFRDGFRMHSSNNESPQMTLKCRQTLPLWFKDGAEQVRIGMVHAQTLINVHETGAGYSIVSLPDLTWLEQSKALFSSGLRSNDPNSGERDNHHGLAMVNADLEDCVEVPTPEDED